MKIPGKLLKDGTGACYYQIKKRAWQVKAGPALKLPISNMALAILTLATLFLVQFHSNEAIRTELNVLNATGKLLDFANKHSGVETKLADDSASFYVDDNGYGNPGDLIYRYLLTFKTSGLSEQLETIRVNFLWNQPLF